MIYLITSSIVLIVAGAAIAKHFERELLEFFGMLMVVAGAFCCIISACVGWAWVASGYQAEIINKEYGTTYTREQVFYASGVIDTIRELQRERIEVNGDLITGGK